MLETPQCHQPLPLGASGSCIRSAKLLVPAGGLLQDSAGETLPPLQPKPLNTCRSAIVPPAEISGLAGMNLPAAPSAGALAGDCPSRAVVATAAAPSPAPAIQPVRLMGPLLVLRSAPQPPSVQRGRCRAQMRSPTGGTQRRLPARA